MTAINISNNNAEDIFVFYPASGSSRFPTSCEAFAYAEQNRLMPGTYTSSYADAVGRPVWRYSPPYVPEPPKLNISTPGFWPYGEERRNPRGITYLTPVRELSTINS